MNTGGVTSGTVATSEGGATNKGGVWMVLAAPGAAGLACPLRAHLGIGVRGEALRRVAAPPGASADLAASALAGARLAHATLRREKYLDRQIIVRFESAGELANVHGRSADLACALAVAAAVLGARGATLPALAATGTLAEDGGIGPVEGVAAKLAAALETLPEGGVFVFPGRNGEEIPPALRARAHARRIALLASFRFEEALARLGVAVSPAHTECPFRGLEPFGFAHAALFFGRDREVAEIRDLLARRGAVLVSGPSGSGKSSLVLAGVLPAALRQGLEHQDGGAASATPCAWGVLRPRDLVADADPGREREALAAAWRAAWCHEQEGGFGLQAAGAPAPAGLDPAAGLAWLEARGAGPGGAGAILVLDQMEGWFDGRFQPATVAALAAFVAELAARGVRLLATMTSAALPALAGAGPLAARFGVEGRYMLDSRPEAGALEAVIREPARAAGLHYEAGLEAALFAAASHAGADVLPLLELLLTELWERRDRERNQLRRADERAVGGLDGVIGARAEAAYRAAPPAAQATLPELLWRLDTAGALLPADDPAASPLRALVEAFRARRLLVESAGEQGPARIHAAHEALLRHWPRAVALRAESARAVATWLDLARESGQWARAERALIPPGPQLEAAAALLARRRGRLTAGEAPVAAYVEASLQRYRRRRLLAAAAIGLPALAVGGFGLAEGWNFVRDLGRTRIRFADIAVPGPDNIIAAAPYLKRFGIDIATLDPARATLLLVNNIALYGGRAVDPYGSQNVLTQRPDPAAWPVGFTLRFERDLAAVGILRARLWAATKSGVTHPAWRAAALAADGSVLATTAEPLLGSHDTIPAAWHRLRAPAGRRIAGLAVRSDDRDHAGVPFAGFQAVLIQAIDLVD